MKKSKLLIAVLSSSAIVTTIVPLISITSCNQKNVVVNSIEATTTLGNVTYEGVIIRKTDIVVKAYKSDGTIDTVTDWTCESFKDGQYVVTAEDVKNTKVGFEIKYAGKTTALIINVGTLTQVNFLFPEITLWKGNGISSQKEIFIYTTGGLSPQILSGKYFNFKFFEDGNESTNVSVKQLGSSDAQYAYVSGTVTGTENLLKIYRKTDTAFSTPLDEMKIKVTTDDLDATINEDKSATLTIKKGTDIEGKGVVTIPEYVNDGNTIHPVTEITTEDQPVNVSSIIIPKTITSIAAGAFNYYPTQSEAKGWVPLESIYYMGSSEQWNNIIAGTNWQGKFVMGAYCSEDSKYVNFSNCLNSKFDPECKEWENKPILLAEKAIGGALGGSYSIKLDYSLITSGEAKDYKNITVYNNASLPLGWLTINGIYLNGYALSSDQYELVDDSGRFGKTIKFKDSVTLDADTKIILEITTPIFSKGSIYIGAHQTV